MSAKSDHQFRYMSWRMLLWVFMCALQIALIASGVILPIFPVLQPLAVSNTVLSLISAGLVTLGAFIVDRIFSKIRHLERNHYSRRPGWWTVLHACQFGVALYPLAVMVMLATLPWSAPMVLGVALAVPFGYAFMRMLFHPFLLSALLISGEDKPSMLKWRKLLLFLGVRTNWIPCQFFLRNTKLKSYTIPDCVTSIGDDAFKGCTSLDNITASRWLDAFKDYDQKINITIPDGVILIERGVFKGCTSLTRITTPNTSITIPEGVTRIDSSAFYNCTSLTSITIPEGVTRIGSNAFHNCTSLTSITIPDSVTSIAEDAFDGCDNLSMVVYSQVMPDLSIPPPDYSELFPSGRLGTQSESDDQNMQPPPQYYELFPRGRLDVQDPPKYAGDQQNGASSGDSDCLRPPRAP